MGIEPWLAAVLSPLWSWAWQLLFGAALTNACILGRSRHAARADVGLRLAGRLLRRTAPWAAIVAGAIWLALRIGVGRGRLAFEPFALALPGTFFALGGFASAGSCLLIAAAHSESRGRRARARRLVRLGGRTVAVSLGAIVALTTPRLFLLPSLPLLAGWIALAASAVAGLLAGLSGKPRPSGTFSIWLYAAGSSALFLSPWIGGS